MSKAVEIEFLIKDRLSGDLDKLGVKTKGLEDKAKSAGAEFKFAEQKALELRNVIALLESQIEQLRLVGQNASPDFDQSSNIAQITALEAQIEELEAELQRLQNTASQTNVVPQQLPQAEKKFNGLHNSIQQMAREMPTLAMGPQMFFLAISNNLPIFTDELARARQEYDNLVASGQKGTPVWKQVLSSLFSWQTALTTGIMLLVMYGDEIVSWAKDLFSAKKSVDEFNISLEEMTELEKDGRAQMVKTRFELDTVIASLKDFTGSKEEEKAKVEELNRKYGESFGYYDTIAKWYDTLIEKSESYVQTLFLQAKAQSMINKAIEVDDEIAKLKATTPEDSESSLNWFERMSFRMTAAGQAESGQVYDSEAKIKEANQKSYDELMAGLEAKKQGYIDQAKALSEEVAQINKDMDIGGHTQSGSGDSEREAQERLRAEEELSERLLDLERENQQEDIELREQGRKQKLSQIELDYKTRKEEIERQSREFAELNKQSGGDGSLTEQQQAEIDKATENNNLRRQQAIAEVYQAEVEAMREHLKEYGTFQQQKLAIAEEYADKIASATTEGEELSLSVERDSSLAKVEAEQLGSLVNWDDIFGEFGNMFSDVFKPVLQEAKQYMQSSEFQNADDVSQQSFMEVVSQLEHSFGETSSVSFRQLGEEAEAYRVSLLELRTAQGEYKGVYSELIEAQKAYKAAMSSGTEAEKQAATERLNAAKLAEQASGSNIKTLQKSAEEAQKSVKNTATTLKSSMDGIVSGLQKITSGSLNGAYSGLIELGNSAKEISGRFSGAFGKMADSLESVPIVGWIASIVDLLKDGLSDVIAGLIDAVFGAVVGILEDVLSGDLLIAIGESLLKGISNLLDSLTFGFFSDWVGNGDSDKTLSEDMEYLRASNEDLRRAIDNLADKMDNATVSEAAEIYAEQIERIRQAMANTQEMMRRSGSAYSNGFLGIGGTHSSNIHIRDGMTNEDWQRISEIVGRGIWGAGDFWDLSSEEMARVAELAPDLYSKIKSLADDGYEDAAQYMDEYIEYYKELEEAQTAYYEKITGISFDSIRDSFKSTLMNLQADASTFSENIGETMLEGIVEGMMSDKYNSRLRQWYNSFAEAIMDGLLSEDEADTLRSMYEAIANEAIAERDALLRAAGIDPSEVSSGASQSGRAGGGFTAMSQEQGTKLEGLFVAAQMHWSSIDANVENVVDMMNIASEHLQHIEDNTGECRDSLSEILTDIRAMRRDGIRVV